MGYSLRKTLTSLQTPLAGSTLTLDHHFRKERCGASVCLLSALLSVARLFIIKHNNGAFKEPRNADIQHRTALTHNGKAKCAERCMTNLYTKVSRAFRGKT